jgi:hypothetical protein
LNLFNILLFFSTNSFVAVIDSNLTGAAALPLAMIFPALISSKHFNNSSFPAVFAKFSNFS